MVLKVGKQRFPVRPISRQTGLSCLGKVTGRVPDTGSLEQCEQKDVLSLEEFVVLARPEFEARPVRLNWGRLTKAAKRFKILVILSNGNVISVSGPGRPGQEEIVVSDPLYEAGKSFFLPRKALESAWQGDALLLSHTAAKEWRTFNSLIMIVSIAGFLLGTFMLAQALYAVVAERIIGTVHAEPPGYMLNVTELGIGDGKSTVRDASEQEQDTIPAINQAGVQAAEENVAADWLTSKPRDETLQPNVIDDSSGSPDANGPALALNLDQPPESPLRGPKLQPAPPDQSASTNTTSAGLEEQPKSAFVRVLSEKELKTVLARGDLMISRGDVHSGRLLYEYAAEAGSGVAALRLGETFDPAFLGLVGLRGVRGDPLKAAQWYERARQLGITEAAVLLRAVLGDNGAH